MNSRRPAGVGDSDFSPGMRKTGRRPIKTVRSRQQWTLIAWACFSVRYPRRIDNSKSKLFPVPSQHLSFDFLPEERVEPVTGQGIDRPADLLLDEFLVFLRSFESFFLKRLFPSSR